ARGPSNTQARPSTNEARRLFPTKASAAADTTPHPEHKVIEALSSHKLCQISEGICDKGLDGLGAGNYAGAGKKGDISCRASLRWLEEKPTRPASGGSHR